MGVKMMDTLSLNIMNTSFYIAVADNKGAQWKEKVVQWLRYVAKQWSRFEQNNEMDQLNRLKEGERMQLSPELYRCLKLANDYYKSTNGLFSPYLKLQLEQHGYSQSFPFHKVTEKSVQTERIAEEPIVFLRNDRVLKVTNQQVDLGGFAKGYIVERIAQWLQQQVTSEYGIVDGGGDMKMWSAEDKVWTIGIANPYKEQEEMSYIKMKNGAIATSNRVYRSWKQHGHDKHHLLNGQTGDVITSRIAQATVVTHSLYVAEVATKLCFLLQPEELHKWFLQHQMPYACFLVEEDEKSYWLKGCGKLNAS